MKSEEKKEKLAVHRKKKKPFEPFRKYDFTQKKKNEKMRS